MIISSIVGRFFWSKLIHGDDPLASGSVLSGVGKKEILWKGFLVGQGNIYLCRQRVFQANLISAVLDYILRAHMI